MPIAAKFTARNRLQRRLGKLDQNTATRLIGISRVRNIPAGRPIIIEGDPAASFFDVQKGVASVFKLFPDGRRQITDFRYPGDFLGVTFNMDADYDYGAETVTCCSLRTWPRSALECLFDEVPGLRRLFLAEIADELTKAQDRVLMLAHRSARERMAIFLLAMARRQSAGRRTRMEAVDIPMRWTDIADYLGTTAETVSRILSEFRDCRVVHNGRRGEIELLDWDMLEAIAGGVRPEQHEICW